MTSLSSRVYDAPFPANSGGGGCGQQQMDESLSIPSNRRSVSLLLGVGASTAVEFARYANDEDDELVDQDLAQVPRPPYSFEHGRQTTEDIVLDYDRAAQQAADINHIISPKQAQALLAAQVILQQQQQARQNPTWMTHQTSGETKEADDPMAILSMSRGNSNLQAALDELDSRTCRSGTTVTQLSPTLVLPGSDVVESPAGGAGVWQDYDERQDPASGYQSDAYTSATDTEECDMPDRTVATATTARLEYDGSKYAQNFDRKPTATVSSTPQPQQPHNAAHPHPHPSYAQQPHHGHHGHHGHHHSHSHSIAPTVPPVVEQVDREADGDEVEGASNDGGLVMDESFLQAISSSLPNNNPSYSRNSSANSLISAGVRSGASSPQPPSQRQVMSHSPTMAQQLAQQHASIVSPTAVLGRRHSGVLPPTAPQATRMLGRSPSADHLPLTLSRTISPAPHNLPTRLNGSPPSDGRGLHLHPSPIQAQLQALHSNSPQPHHANKVNVKLENLSPQPPAQPPQYIHNAASNVLPPRLTPSLGSRSFSHESVVTIASKTDSAYYSDGGDSGYTSYAGRMPSSAGGSPRSSATNLHLATHAPEHGYSAASSGTTTPLCGPGSLRGSNSMGDLHRLLMLHQQSTGPVSTLLPLCPTGSSASAAAAAHPASCSGPHAASERIGAYTREERAKRLARYIDKRSRRCWTKRVLYQVRKDFALGRKRVGGRFIKKQNPGCPCPDLCVPECVNYVAPDDAPPLSKSVSSASPSPPAKKK